MSTAVKREKRPPTFYTEVEVDIDPSELEEAGWVYVGKGAAGDAEPVRSDDEWITLIRENHEAEHEGPMRWCRHELCMAVTR